MSTVNSGLYSKPAEMQGDIDMPTSKWYDPELRGRLTESAAKFWSEYTGLSSEELIPHLYKQRDQAWSISPWPYIGHWSFLNSRIRLVANVDSILATLKAGGSILDLGCGLGQELRWLAYRGAPTEKMFASDLLGAFWDAGYELFRDRTKFHAHFTQANILDPSNALITNESLKGSMDVVYMGCFLHVFNHAEQLQALKTVVGFSKVGSVICGFQWGLDRSLLSPDSPQIKAMQTFHDDQTMLSLWKRLEEETGTSWKTVVSMHPMSEFYVEESDHSWAGKGPCVLIFRAERIS